MMACITSWRIHTCEHVIAEWKASFPMICPPASPSQVWRPANISLQNQLILQRNTGLNRQFQDRGHEASVQLMMTNAHFTWHMCTNVTGYNIWEAFNTIPQWAPDKCVLAFQASAGCADNTYQQLVCWYNNFSDCIAFDLTAHVPNLMDVVRAVHPLQRPERLSNDASARSTPSHFLHSAKSIISFLTRILLAICVHYESSENGMDSIYHSKFIFMIYYVIKINLFSYNTINSYFLDFPFDWHMSIDALTHVKKAMAGRLMKRHMWDSCLTYIRLCGPGNESVCPGPCPFP